MHLKYDRDYYSNSLKKVAMFVANGVTNDSRVIKTAQSIKKLGYDITVFGLGKQTHVKHISGFQFPIKLLPRPDIYARTLGVDIAPSNFSDADYVKYAALALSDALSSTELDILHTHDMIGLSVGARCISQMELPCKWVHDIHEYVDGLTELRDDVRVYYAEEERQHILRPDVLTTVSPDLSKILADTHALKVAPRIVLNAPRLSDFDPNSPDIRSHLGLPQAAKIYVYVGNVKPVRGVDIIIDALAKNKNDYLVILTNSANQYVDDLKAKIKAFGLTENVMFLPYVAFNQVTSFLRTADIGIHPIKRYPNAEIALPNKLFEYIHAGLPVISSNVNAMKTFIDTYNCGASFLNDDVSSLVNAVDEVKQRLSTDTGWKGEIRGLKYDFCWERQEEELQNIYNEISPAATGVKPKTETLKLKVLQLPVPAAGQPNSIAKGLISIGHVASVLTKTKHKFQYPYDIFFDHSVSFNDALRKLRNIFSQYDILHYHAVPLVWEKKFAKPTGFDLFLARLLGKKIFYHFRGSEARLENCFRNTNKYHYCDDETHLFEQFPEAEQKLYLEFVKSVSDCAFVVDPELQTYVPEATIVPRTIDLDAINKIGIMQTCNDEEKIVIAHAPSRRAVKGTDWVIKAVEDLKHEGINVELKIIENMSNDEALLEYSRADIIVDQLRIGWYGVLAVEAMALGKPVVAFIRDDLKHNLPFPFPLSIANRENIKAVLLELISDRSLRMQLGKSALEYVKDAHCSKNIAEQLIFLYGASFKPQIDEQSLFRWFYEQNINHAPITKTVNLAGKSDLKPRRISHLYNLRYNFARLTNYAQRNGFKSTLVKLYKKTNVFFVRNMRRH